VAVALELAGRMADLPPQALRDSKALLNRALQHAVSSWLPGAVAAESASFEEPAFQGNLARLRGGRS
jgi:enoyl-CoA hydratase